MISVDTNILFYSLNPASQWHLGAVHFLNSSLSAPEARVALTDYVLVELYVLLRNLPSCRSRSPHGRSSTVTQGGKDL